MQQAQQILLSQYLGNSEGEGMPRVHTFSELHRKLLSSPCPGVTCLKIIVLSHLEVSPAALVRSTLGVRNRVTDMG